MGRFDDKAAAVKFMNGYDSCSYATFDPRNKYTIYGCKNHRDSANYSVPRSALRHCLCGVHWRISHLTIEELKAYDKRREKMGLSPCTQEPTKSQFILAKTPCVNHLHDNPTSAGIVSEINSYADGRTLPTQLCSLRI